MNASTLDQRIELIEPVVSKSPMGGDTVSKSIKGRVWAGMRWLKGREYVEAQARNNQSEAVFIVRYSTLTAKIKPSWLIRQGSREWQVVGEPMPFPASRPEKIEIMVKTQA